MREMVYDSAEKYGEKTYLRFFRPDKTIGEISFHGFSLLVEDLSAYFYMPENGCVALELLFHAVDAALHDFDIRKDKFGVDGVGVADGVDGVFDVDDVAAVETAHHVDYGVHLAYVRKEFVAQSLALAGALVAVGVAVAGAA